MRFISRHITPLVINSLGRGYTHRHTRTRTLMIRRGSILRNQVRAWFKNIICTHVVDFCRPGHIWNMQYHKLEQELMIYLMVSVQRLDAHSAKVLTTICQCCYSVELCHWQGLMLYSAYEMSVHVELICACVFMYMKLWINGVSTFIIKFWDPIS